MSQKPSSSNSLMKYSGMAVQFAVMIAIGVFVGKKLDAYFGNEKSIYTAICAFTMLFASFYLIFKDILKGTK